LPRAVRGALIGALLLLVLLIGLWRIWLGHHYPTDVLAGWTAGAVIVLLYRWFTRPVPREPAEGVAVDTGPPPV
jgi:undecaprenyl-diphosphatase